MSGEKAFTTRCFETLPFAPASVGAFFWCRPPIRNLGRRSASESGKIYEGECIKWTLTYLYLTMIELLVPPKG